MKKKFSDQTDTDTGWRAYYYRKSHKLLLLELIEAAI